MKNIAVILAGGSGSRVGGDIPKQFLPLADGRTVFETCVQTFEDCPAIDHILVVMLSHYIPMAQQLCTDHAWSKVCGFVHGGSERWQSSWNALTRVKELLTSWNETDCNVLLHDCARPFVSTDILLRVCQALRQHAALSVTVPVTDTIYTVIPGSQGECLRSIPTRSTLRAAQTPQAFRFSIVYDAYGKALAQQTTLPATDDCGVVLIYRPDVSIHLVQGAPDNRKLTYAADMK